MSNPHNNAYRPLKPANTADISRAPAHVQQAFDKPVPPRDGEVSAMTVVRHKNVNFTIPNTRLHPDIEVIDGTPRGVSLRVTEYRGIEMIAQLEISFSELPTLIARLTELQNRIEAKE